MGPLREGWGRRELLLFLLWREVKGETAKTLLGPVWVFLPLLAQVASWWFLLGWVLGMRLGEKSFLDYFLLGMVPWVMMTEVVQKSINALVQNTPLFMRAPFPLAALPLLPPLFAAILYTIPFALLAGLQEGALSGALAFLLVPAFLFWILPGCYLFSALGVILPDAAKMIPLALNALFYLTPVLYPPQRFPAPLAWSLALNPLADWMAILHGVLESHAMPWASALRVCALWIVSLGPSWYLFHKAGRLAREVL